MIDHLPKELFPDHTTLLFLDTETSGLDEKECYVVELGVVQYLRDDDGSWYRANEISDLIKLPNGESIPDEVSEKNHITDDMLSENGIERYGAFSKLAGLIGEKTVLAAYNTHFDYKFLLKEFERCFHEETPYGEPLFSPQIHKLSTVDIYDGMLTARARVRGTDENGKSIRHRLVDMIDYYELEGVENSHRALADVEALISLTKSFHEERDDLSDYINCFPYYEKYGVPSGVAEKVEDPGKFTFMNEDTIKHVFEPERFYDFSVTAVAKPHKPPLYRYDVPDGVVSAINTVLGQPNTEVVYVERADCEPDCGHLYHFISKNTSGDKPLYVGGTFDAKEKMIPELSGEPLYDFISAKSFINDRFVDGDGFYPSVNDLKEISVIDQLAVYNYGLISNPSNTTYLDVYKRLDQDIMDNKPINLVYHSLDKSSYIELTVDMDLVNHRYSVKADNCLIGYGVYKDNYDMMKDFKRIHGDPLQFDKIVNVYEDVAEERSVAYLLAYSLRDMENPDVAKNEPHSWVDEFDNQLAISKIAQDITGRPYYYAEKVDSIAAVNPDLYKEAQRFKNIMDKLCDHVNGEPTNMSVLLSDADELQFDCNYYAKNDEHFSPFIKSDDDRTE